MQGGGLGGVGWLLLAMATHLEAHALLLENLSTAASQPASCPKNA